MWLEAVIPSPWYFPSQMKTEAFRLPNCRLITLPPCKKALPRTPSLLEFWALSSVWNLTEKMEFHLILDCVKVQLSFADSSENRGLGPVFSLWLGGVVCTRVCTYVHTCAHQEKKGPMQGRKQKGCHLTRKLSEMSRILATHKGMQGLRFSSTTHSTHQQTEVQRGTGTSQGHSAEESAGTLDFLSASHHSLCHAASLYLRIFSILLFFMLFKVQLFVCY